MCEQNLKNWHPDFIKYVSDNNISAKIENVEGSAKRIKMFGISSKHFKYTLKANGKRILSGQYSQGCGIKDNPTIYDILYCIIQDAYAYYTYTYLEDFCDAFGYDVDDKESYRIYSACVKSFESLNNAGIWDCIPSEMDLFEQQTKGE